jgi:hypothetical protein
VSPARASRSRPIFVDALAAFPQRLDVEQIVRNGSGQLSKYEAAGEAARVLTRLAGHREQLADLGYRSGLGQILDDRTRFAAYATPDAFHDRGAFGQTGPFGQWTAIVRTAGVDLEWRSLEQQRRTAAMVARPTETVRS